ncbi:hypothetical protein [Breoghania sp.]|uniref:hypothetical protein n=1 Tax=Breoghania sp. TaxID=2065378 RepID=UPI002626B32B|nr:hypothetical protein [Breoghania sp.]MDJ0932059.1 hypothetical protein [Breoghania sp.]
MCAEKVKGIPTREKAEQIKGVNEILYPGVAYEIVEEAGGTFAVQPVNAETSSVTTKPQAHPMSTPGNLKPLYDLIGKAESNNNYNAYYAHAGNQNDPELTAMSVGSGACLAEDLCAVRQPVEQIPDHPEDTDRAEGADGAFGNGSVRRRHTGRHGENAAGPARVGGLSEFQDVGGGIRQQPREGMGVVPGDERPQKRMSYYSGDGLNEARVKVDQVTAVLASIKGA